MWGLNLDVTTMCGIFMPIFFVFRPAVVKKAATMVLFFFFHAKVFIRQKYNLLDKHMDLRSFGSRSFTVNILRYY